MRIHPRLGAVNLALISLYLAPLWGADAMRTLKSPLGAFAEPAHAVAAMAARRLFDVSADGLVRIANLLGGIKLVIAAGLLAYLIEFLRAVATGREVDRATLDVVLLLAVGAIAIWSLPALRFGDPALVRLHTSQLLLVLGALIVVLVDRRGEQALSPRPVFAPAHTG